MSDHPAAPKPEENQIIAERRAKLAALREQGNAFPNDFKREHLAADLHAAHGAFLRHDDVLVQRRLRVNHARLCAERGEHTCKQPHPCSDHTRRPAKKPIAASANRLAVRIVTMVSISNHRTR